MLLYLFLLVVAEFGCKLTVGDSDVPLILTPYLEQGQIDQAKQAASVKPFVGNVSSYAGYFTVNKQYDSNIFFWYFPSEMNPETAPVVVWIPGGPGLTSVYDMFYVNGPYMFVNDGKSIGTKDIYWSKSMHMIYIDSPIGTGYSYTNNSDGYSKDGKSISTNLYETLRQFFILFPDLSKRNLYLSGRGYSGKFAVNLAFLIHQQNMNNGTKINLKGLAVTSPFIDPINQIDYGIYLYEIGLIDNSQMNVYNKYQDGIKKSITGKKWEQAYRYYNNIMSDNLTNANSLFYKYTGFNNIYNYLVPQRNPFDIDDQFLNDPSFQRQINVGNRSTHTFLINPTVKNNSITEYMQSVAPTLAFLLNNKYRALFYNGQLDIARAYPLAMNFLRKLKWCGSNDFNNTSRQQWKMDDQLAGYITTASCKGSSLSSVLVRNASHRVAQFQPLWAYVLISNFTSQ